MITAEEIKEFAEVCQEFKIVEARKKELAAKFKDAESSGEKIPSVDFGKLVFTTRRQSWNYSDSLKKEMDTVKIKQEKEQRKGDASPVFSHSVTFKPSD